MRDRLRDKRFFKKDSKLEEQIIYFEQTSNARYLSIFEEEKQKIGLSDVDIELCVPNRRWYSNSCGGFCYKNINEGYTLGLTYNYFNLDNDDSFDKSLIAYKFIIRHELSHIKHGHCDIKLTKTMNSIFGLIHEPIAMIYPIKCLILDEIKRSKKFKK